MLNSGKCILRPVVLLCLLCPAVGISAEPIVMTRNLYLGADVAPIFLAAATGGDVAQAAAVALTNAIGPNNFNSRVAAIAAEINTEKPDLVGLQEVTTITGPGFVIDFEQSLMPRLPDYQKVIKTSEGVFSLAGVGSLETANMILKRTRPDLIVSPGEFGEFLAAGPAFMGQTVKRNWQTVNATFGGKPFLFLNTHLEPDNDSVSTAQALELIAGPLTTKSLVIAVGDYNSDPSKNSGAYKALTGSRQGKLRDAVKAGNTCCRAEILTIPEAGHPDAALTERIDLVLTSPSIRLLSGKRTGVNQVGGIYPSDHTGVVAKLTVH